MKLIAILIVLIFSYSLFAQNNGNEIYAIKVELNFSSYSNCRILDTEKPKLSSWNLKFGERDKIVQYGYQYIDTFITNNSIEDLSLNLNVNIIHFDGNQSVTIDDGNLVNSTKFSIGKNYLKKSESKHCSPFHTEGFDFHPIVTIDNPIKIESTSVIGEKSIGKMSTNFVTTRQTVVFHLNEFYKENDDIELQYSIGNIDNWKPVKSYKGEFKSQGSISINYSDIVGEYSITNSDYIEKLGKCIFFRIEKTLLDGKTKVYSNTVNKNFFQDYAEFSVDETSVYMSSCGKLSLTLSDVDPITIREIRKLNIKLTQDPISYIPTISQIADDKIRLSYTFDGYSPEDLKRIAEKELFITISAEANIEEIDSINPQNIKFAHPHQAEFKISAHSEPLHFKQSAPTIVGKNKNYHLNHNETPYYAILQMDKEDEYNRIPYIVKWSDYKGTHFQKIERTNKIYDKEILRQKYFAEHNDKYFEDRWATFFNSKFNEWFNELITPQVVQKIMYEENCSCPWSSNSSSEMLVPINCGNSVKIFFFNYYNLQFEDGNPKSIGSSGRYIVIKSEDNEALFRHVKDKISNYYNLEGTKITEICDDYTTYETTNKSIIGTILKNQSVPNTFSFSISKDVFNSLSFNNKDEYFIIKKGEQYCLANCNNSYYLISFLEYEQKKLLHYDNHVTKCILSYKGDACAFVSNNVLYYNNKRLGNATAINDLKSIYNNYIYYIGNDGKNYKRIIANYDDKNTYKNNFKSNYSSLYNKWLREYKDICFQQYILMLEGYKIDNIEANTNYIFTITDNDGCPIYETGSNTDKEIDVNVQVPIKPNVSFSIVRTPSSICSQDGEVRAKINTNSTEQQLYYLYNNKETIITSGTEVKLQGIGFSEIKLYSDFLEYSYASPFKISDPSEYEGIKNVISYNNSCYNTETPNGQIIVEFNKISSIKKICHLLENNKKIKSIETNGEKVSFNNLKSGNNYTIEVDIIDGNKNKCSLNWGKSISIYNSIFSYTVSNNDATTIGGKGSINIIKENNPKNFDIQWSCNKQPLNSVELPIINSAGDYKIEANWGGCVLSKGITIREPYCKANIEVIHNGAKGEIKITGTDSCLTTNSGFPYFEVDGNKGLEFKDLDINSYHTIKYVYGEGLSWVIAEVKAKNVVTENNHTFSILKPHKCSGDDAEYLITANAENVFFILNGKEYKEIRGSTSLGSISYKVKELNETREIKNSKSTVSIKYSTIRTYTEKEKLKTVEKICAFVDNDISFPCSYSDVAPIEIRNITGGNSSTKLQYCLKNDNSEIFNNLNVVGNRSTINANTEGSHVLYLKDVGNNCEFIEIGTLNIKRPKEISVDIVSKDPFCKNGENGQIKVVASNGTNRLDSNGESMGYIYEISNHKIDINEEKNICEDTYKSLASTNAYEKTNLPSGEYHIYVIDGNFCKYETTRKLNNYINPSISFASTDTTSCYEFNDGSINGIEIKTNEIFNGTKVLPRRLFYSFKSANEELYSSVDSVAIDTINKIDGLSAGLYKLWVEDDNGCLTNEDERYSVVVHQPDPINLSFSSDTIKIKEKGNLGQVKVRVDGGNNGYKYVIVYTDTIGVVTGEEYILNSKFLNVGNHIIKASDKNNCQSNEKNITLIEPQKPLEVSIETTDAECHAKTGSAKIIISGGWKGKNGYNVQLIGKSVNMTHSDDEIVYKSLYAGKYELVVTDDMGVVLRNDVVINAPDSLVISKEVTPTYCDANSGSVSITIDGGTPQYRTFIYGAIDTIDAPNVSFNNLSCLRVDGYKVKTIDEKGCTSVATFAIPDSSLAVKITDNYFGGSATMIATISGGNANGTYQYEWKYGLDNKLSDCNSNSLTTNKSGVYYFKVTNEYTLNNENILCSTGYIPHSLIIDGDRKMKIVEIQRETGEDRRDGRVKLYTDKTNFVSLKLYSSDNVVVNVKPIFDADGYIVIDSLSGGYHSVEGILENGKRRMVDFYIQPYKKMVGFAVVTRNVQKPKGNDGEILVNVSNGIAPYNISITSNDNFNIKNYHTTENRLQLNNISAGIYNAIVMDSVGNKLELGSLHIIEPDSLSVYYQSTPANCYGDSNATVTLFAEGGWKDYQFADSKNKKFGHSNIFSGLNAGQHLFYVMDSYGTIDSIATIVNQPDILKASINSIDSVKCYGNSDGSVSFNINGGSPKYKTKIFSSDNFSDISEETIFNKLSSKNYIATFTDSHGCSSKDTLKFFIPQPDTFMIANSLAINTTCELDNGKISIEMKGGTLPYNYKWTENGIEYNKATTIEKVKSEAINLKQNGLYHVKIVDYHGCTAEYEKRIEHSENPQILDITTDDVLCYGDSSGIAIVDSSQIKLGFPPVPYHLIWPQGQENVMTVNTLSSGTHIVKITDDNNCSTTKEFFIGTPKPIKNHLLGIRNALCYGYNDGRIETFTTGGVGSYNYIWNNGEQTSFVSNLKAGTYKLVVSDEHECKDSATFEITEPEKLHVELGDDVVICPGNVHVFDAGDFTTYSWKKEETGEVIESKRFFTISEEGNYSIIVTDSIGCFAYDTVNLSIGNNALIANFLVASDAVVNDTITLVELSNMPIDSLCWEYNEESFRDITPFDVEDYICNLLAEDTGRFYITLRAYSGGCEATEQKQIDIHKIATDNYDFKMGYNPMIKSVKISPNPNNGEFELNVLLREEVDINVIINDVNTGRQVECFVLSGSDSYNHKLNIKQLNSGIFVLSVG